MLKYIQHKNIYLNILEKNLRTETTEVDEGDKKFKVRITDFE